MEAVIACAVNIKPRKEQYTRFVCCSSKKLCWAAHKMEFNRVRSYKVVLRLLKLPSDEKIWTSCPISSNRKPQAALSHPSSAKFWWCSLGMRNWSLGTSNLFYFRNKWSNSAPAIFRLTKLVGLSTVDLISGDYCNCFFSNAQFVTQPSAIIFYVRWPRLIYFRLLLL